MLTEARRGIVVFAVLLVPLWTPAARAAEPTTAPTPAAVPGPVRLVLPPMIYALPGIECNLYFDNVVLVLNRHNYAFEAICDKGNQLDERWTFTPKEEDVGTYPIEVVVRDESNAVIARGSTQVRVVSRERDTKVTSLLLVGASITQYSIYPQHLLDLDNEDEHFSLKMIGSRGPNNAPATGPLRHEGYSGWTAQAFVTLRGPLSRTGEFKRPGTGSPFVYEDQPDGPHLDFGRYCKQFNDGVGPDAIIIHLIPNDIFNAKDENIDAEIDTMIGYYDQLLEAFHKVRPETRIGITLTMPATFSQDGFRGYAGPRRQTRWQYRRNIHRAWERMIAKYQSLESKQIYLVPTYVNFDVEQGYPMREMPINARTTTRKARVTNGTHPSPDGYKQIGDALYCWLKAVAP